jgi:hypothetical protein
MRERKRHHKIECFFSTTVDGRQNTTIVVLAGGRQLAKLSSGSVLVIYTLIALPGSGLGRLITAILFEREQIRSV